MDFRSLDTDASQKKHEEILNEAETMRLFQEYLRNYKKDNSVVELIRQKWDAFQSNWGTHWKKHHYRVAA